MNDAIHVGLYGIGSRDARRRAEYIYCDHAAECSLYRDGKCFCVTAMFGHYCPLGHICYVDGGTKRSKAFERVSKDAMEHPKYHALMYPEHDLVARIGEQILIQFPHVTLEKADDGTIKIEHGGFRGNLIVESKSILTPKNILRICEFRRFRALAIQGGVEKDYQNKTVPEFLKGLSKLFPEEYANFIATFPKYAGRAKDIDYRGRTAKLATCNRAMQYADMNGNLFTFDGDFLVCENCKINFHPFQSGSGNVYMKIKLTDEMTVKITDNAQVTEETVFV